ncbi:hypothetical protein [Kosakonia oryzae]
MPKTIAKQMAEGKKLDEFLI